MAQIFFILIKPNLHVPKLLCSVTIDLPQLVYYANYGNDQLATALENIASSVFYLPPKNCVDDR